MGNGTFSIWQWNSWWLAAHATCICLHLFGILLYVFKMVPILNILRVGNGSIFFEQCSVYSSCVGISRWCGPIIWSFYGGTSGSRRFHQPTILWTGVILSPSHTGWGKCPEKRIHFSVAVSKIVLSPYLGKRFPFWLVCFFQYHQLDSLNSWSFGMDFFWMFLQVALIDALFFEKGNIYIYVCQGLNSHYFHIVGDGHQPNSRGLFTHYKDSY